VVLSSTRDHLNRLSGIDDLRVRSITELRRLCTIYRLRFLPGARYKGEPPSEAIAALRALERAAGRPLKGFRVLAPVGAFNRAGKARSGSLYIRIADDRYYLVHRWGRDEHPVRAIAAWPLRSPVTLSTSVVLLALLCAAVVPADGPAGLFAGKALLFFWSLMALCAVTAYCWFTLGQRFNSEAWDR
jgi:hypothetical protein